MSQTQLIKCTYSLLTFDDQNLSLFTLLKEFFRKPECLKEVVKASSGEYGCGLSKKINAIAYFLLSEKKSRQSSEVVLNIY